MSTLNEVPNPSREAGRRAGRDGATVGAALVGLLFAAAMLLPWIMGVCGCTMFTLSVTLLVLATSLGVGTTALGALTVEREKKTLDSLRLTQLTANQVLLAKISPDLTRLATVMAVLSPGIVAVGVVSGESLIRIFGALAIAALAGLFSTIGALLVSSLCETTSQAVVTGWVARGVWLLLTPVLDFVAGAVLVQSSAPPIFTSINPLAAFAALDVPEAVSGARLWLPAFYGVATLLSCALFWRIAARRFDNGLAGGGGLRDKRVHDTWRGRGPVALTHAIPGLAHNPSFLRELASQMRAGAGRWPGYLVFVVLFLAPTFYAHCWTLNDLRSDRLHDRAELATVSETADLPQIQNARVPPKNGPTSSLALHISGRGGDFSETVVVVEGHTSLACLRLALYRGLGIAMPREALRFYTVQATCPDDPTSLAPRTPMGSGEMWLENERVPNARTARILGLEMPQAPVAEPSDALATSAKRASLHVGLAGAIALLLLYLSIRFSAFLATSVTGEKAHRTWEDLALTGISAREAMMGKVGGAMILPLLQMTLVFPVLGLFVVSGNLTVLEVASLYVYAVALSAAAAMLGLWASATSHTSHDAHLKALGLVLGAFFILPLFLPLLRPVLAPLALILAIAGGRRPLVSFAWFCVSLALWVTPGAATPLTAAVSFMPSLTTSQSFLRVLSGGFIDPVMGPFYLFGGVVMLLATAYLLQQAALDRLTTEGSDAIEAETRAQMPGLA